MTGSLRKPPYEKYSPGRRDARIEEARMFLMGARHLRNLTPLGLLSQFNLKPETAERLHAAEVARRGYG